MTIWGKLRDEEYKWSFAADENGTKEATRCESEALGVLCEVRGVAPSLQTLSRGRRKASNARSIWPMLSTNEYSGVIMLIFQASIPI